MPRRTLEDTLHLGIERGLIAINDTTIRYLPLNREYPRDPEELVRAALVVEIVEDYLYSPSRIALEVAVPRRTPNDFADIVVYSDDARLNNYIVVEAKRADCSEEEFTQALEQGFGNANSLRAPFLLVDCFSRATAFDVQNHPQNERQANRIPSLPVNYGLVPTYRLHRGGPNDLRPVSFDDLARLFQRCHDILWSGGKLDPASAFDEMSKLFFAKIQDERNTPNGSPYGFQIGQHENEVIVAQRCASRYREARAVDPTVFTDPISVSDTKVKAVVEVLQDVSLSETDLDAKGQAFEKFLGVVFRGELGQYFTRRQIVEFVVDLLEPDERDLMLDPACGSGGFLLYCMKKVAQDITRQFAGNQRLIDRKIYDFTRTRVFGIDINAKIARVAMMDMIVNDDGHTNIENNTGFNATFANPSLGFGRFSLIMTNPPFGVSIKSDDRDNLGTNSFANFQFGGARKSQVSDILFLEQYHRFLTDDDDRNPRAGVVLQVGVLNNPTNKDLLDWLKRHFKVLAVVALPDFTFRKAGSGMKTCLIFLRKYGTPYPDIESVPHHDVFFAVASHIGYDSTLRPDQNDLPRILEHFRHHTQDQASGTLWLPFRSLAYRLDPGFYFNTLSIADRLGELQRLGHQLVPLSQLVSRLNAGKSPAGGVTRSSGEFPSVTVSNITRDGTLDFTSDLNFVPDDFFQEFLVAKGGLQFHDILIAKDGATTGKTAIVDADFPFLDNSTDPPTPKAIFSEHVFRLRMKPGIDPRYIHAFLNGELGQLQLETVTTGGAQGGITTDFAESILIPLVTEPRQLEIADHWEQEMGQANQLRLRYEESTHSAKADVHNLIRESPPMPLVRVQEIVAAAGEADIDA